MQKNISEKILVKVMDECLVDYCIYCSGHKRIARKDFCLEKVKAGNICKDCFKLLSQCHKPHPYA